MGDGPIHDNMLRDDLNDAFSGSTRAGTRRSWSASTEFPARIRTARLPVRSSASALRRRQASPTMRSFLSSPAPILALRGGSGQFRQLFRQP